jgi:hypothetical protein
MIPKRITGATRYLGAPAGWAPEDGNCAHLAIRDVDGCCESAWEPTPDELEALNSGGAVVLCVKGGQPPVMLFVERAERGEQG